MFPKIGVPQNGWFIKENPIKMKMDDLGVPLFLETSILVMVVTLLETNTRPPKKGSFQKDMSASKRGFLGDALVFRGVSSLKLYNSKCH